MQEQRQLGAGTILDRGLTLFAGSFGRIIAVPAVTYAPLAVVQWFVLAPLVAHMEALGPAARSGTPPSLATLFGPDGAQRFALSWGLNVFAYALVRSALIATIDGAAAGDPPPLRAAYALALRRLPAQVGASLLAAVLAFVVWFAGIVIGALIAVPLRAPAILVAAMVAMAVPLAWIFLAYELASVAVARGASGVAGLAYGLRVAFGRGRLWRTLLAGLALGGVALGGELTIVMVGGVLGALANVPPLEFAVASLLSIVLDAFVTVLVVVYAGTVSATAAAPGREPAPQAPAPLNVRTDAGLRDEDIALLEGYFAQLPQVDAATRARMAGELAGRIRPTLRANYNNLDDEGLLEFLARRD